MALVPSLQDTIVAPITPQGTGAIAVIRLSGRQAITLTQSLFEGKNLLSQPSHTVVLGTLRDEDKILDEVLVTVFKTPHSFTRENVVEIACHGSPIVVESILKLLCRQGARMAEAGEFTKRAFLHGRIDLIQAEAIAELIASETEAAQQLALRHMKGGFSNDLATMRKELIHFASLIELELDFSEEDVAFANQEELTKRVEHIQCHLTTMIESFDVGNVIKQGITVVIAGKSNAGKSTLFNTLLNEERVIVSTIPGTTRDAIEAILIIEGIKFRFVDTAGFRETSNPIEIKGIERTQSSMKNASYILYLFDLEDTSFEAIQREESALCHVKTTYINVGNKIDKASPELIANLQKENYLLISAQTGKYVEKIKDELIARVRASKKDQQDVRITNVRHYNGLTKTYEALACVLEGLSRNVSGDMLASDIRHALHEMGMLTGEITTDSLLDTIFSKFCIGK